MQLIGTVEIILRNRIHEALVKELRLNLPNHQQLDDRWYSYINSEPETISKLNAALKNRNGRAKRPEPSSNQVISKMSFGFWPNILKNTTFFSIQNHNYRIDWDRCFKSIFPGLHSENQGFWNSFANRERVIARCFTVNSIRNRVAHFEPVWKFGLDPSEVIERHGVRKTYGIKPANTLEMIQRLSREAFRIKELLSWLSPESGISYDSSENNREITWLISENAINSFIEHRNAKSISMNSFSKPKTLKRTSKNTSGCSSITMNKKKIGILFIYP